jgi:hypothetical protein
MNRVVLLASVLLVFCSAPEATAQIERRTISVTDRRPVLEAIMEIERRHDVAISLEDAPLVYADDLEDVTLEVRKDLAEFAARGEEPPPVILPRNRSLNLSYDIDSVTGAPIDLQRTLANLFQAHTDAGNTGTFRVVPGPDMMHVVPVSSRGAAGTVVAVTPVLDSAISVSLQNTNGLQALRIFSEAVSMASGQTVLTATIPTNLFLNTPITLDETEGIAREILIDILAQIPVRLSWKLLYGITPDPFYALNIHVVE